MKIGVVSPSMNSVRPTATAFPTTAIAADTDRCQPGLVQAAPTDELLLDGLQRAAFGYFVQAVNPANGLVADTSRRGLAREHRGGGVRVGEPIPLPWSAVG